MRKLKEEMHAISWIRKREAVKLTAFTIIFSFVAGAVIALFNFGIQSVLPF